MKEEKLLAAAALIVSLANEMDIAVSINFMAPEVPPQSITNVDPDLIEEFNAHFTDFSHTTTH